MRENERERKNETEKIESEVSLQRKNKGERNEKNRKRRKVSGKNQRDHIIKKSEKKREEKDVNFIFKILIQILLGFIKLCHGPKTLTACTKYFPNSLLKTN